MHQVGLDPYADSTVAIARKISTSLCCNLCGVYIHAAHSYDARDPSQARAVAVQERDAASHFYRKLVKEGIIAGSSGFCVGVGSTPTVSCPPDDGWDAVTELHAGNYVTYDTMQLGIGSCHSVDEDLALRVRCRVLSHRPRENRLLVDLGWTGLSVQGGGSVNGFGRITNFPELQIKSLKQETGEIGPMSSEENLDFSHYPIGITEIEIASYHSCAVSHQYDRIFVVDKNRKHVETWERCPRH